MGRFIFPLMQIDRRGFLWVATLAQDFRITHLARWFSKLGDGYLYAILGLFIYWLDAIEGDAFVTCAMSAFALELPLYLILKNAIRRPRPKESIIDFVPGLTPSDRFSFPSGHTAAAFLFATVLSAYYPSLMFIAFGLAAIIGMSRVLLGVHYPSDIAAGILLGIGCAMWALQV